MKLVVVVLVVTPSPKFQKRFVMVPVELSVKVTVNGLTPRTGLPTKLAAGTTAPVPVTLLELLPALLLVMTTTLLKLAALEGAKRITRFVEPKPGKVKGVPEMMVNVPALILTKPLERVPPPILVNTKVL